MIINYNKKLNQTAKMLRKNSTLAEILLWKQLKNKKIKGLDFHRQKPIGNYIVDFYCPDLKFAIEIDGASHGNKEEYDNAREKYLNSIGIRVLHFKDSSVKKNLSAVIDAIVYFIDDIKL